MLAHDNKIFSKKSAAFKPQTYQYKIDVYKRQGKGAETLRKHGIYVESGILKKECDRINDVFFHYITYKTPFVVIKYAMTADGKIACYNGESKWITGERARENVQKSRLRYSAVMVGAGTVIADDPMLTCRLRCV